MRTGPTNKETKSTAILLERQAGKSKKMVFAEVAERLLKPSRKRACVNIFRLNAAAKSAKGKVLVVPGKVLATGNAQEKIEVACLNCSAGARKKIEATKGKVMGLKEIAGLPSNKMVIVE